MYKKCRFLFLYLLALTFVLSTATASAAVNKCSDLFANSSQAGPQNATEAWNTLYKKSDLSPRPQVWLRIQQGLQKNVAHLEHPLESAGHNADKIGEAYKRMVTELPLLRELMNLSYQMDQGRFLSHADFIKIKRTTAIQLIRIGHKPQSDLQVFAALEALRLISNIETRVEFPKTKEEIQKEEQKKKEEEKEKEKEKKKKEEEKEEEDQEEEDPEWNKTEDKYKPENKDLGDSSNNKNKKKKNVDLVLTDADVYKGLFRQKIYDQFNLQDWNNVVVGRPPVHSERKFTKKLIINTLSAPSVDVPVPYGFTLVPGKYPDHTITQVGAGEFTVQTTSKTPVTLGLARITKETILPSPPRATNPAELAHWPQHLLLFAQSLKGLPPLEAAAKLEKYISLDGGFLYYSKGDKIDKEGLQKLDQKFQQLLTTMPKPMAMAQIGAFNCDGAAWIGALLLRDVVNLNVRIAGGRTDAGTKTINQEKFHVVKSADPAHAWLEVFDGTHWVPFDMTPKKNTPDGESAPTDVERPQEDKPEQDKKDKKDQKDSKEKKGSPDSSKQDSDKKEKGEKGDKKDEDKKDAEKGDKKEDGKKDKDGKGEKKDGKEDKDGKDAKEDEQGEGAPGSKKVEDLINAKSTQRQQNEQNMALIERIIKRNELTMLEHMIQEGYQTKSQGEANQLLDALKINAIWRNPIERSKAKMASHINETKFAKYTGLQNLLNEVRVDFRQDHAREAKQKLISAQKLFIALTEYRNLTKPEAEALHAIEAIMRTLDQIKHANSKEFDAVQSMLKDLPGNVSKSWLAKQYGKDFDQLGSAANTQVAKDIVKGKLKPLLQMGAVRDFVDMTLNSTPEPQWKEEPTLNRSLVPKPRQDLIITRNPLDFAKMLWSLRPGEHMFAPTLQGRQFAIGSLETRRVVNPKNPLERKVSVVYYDISPSMEGRPLEAQDALLLAFADKALSETDAIGRPTHEIYLIPFNDKIMQGVHISSREDAMNFLANRMNMRTSTSGGTDIQLAVENFYDIIATSYKNKAAQGREKMFQKANMVLFTDGGSNIDMAALEAKRKNIPKDVEINMNLVSIGDSVNETLVQLATNGKLSSSKPMARTLESAMTDAVANISADYDANAFATNQKMTGTMLATIDGLLQKINVDTRQKANTSVINRNLSQVQVVDNKDVSKLSGLREAMNLTQFETAVASLKLDTNLKQRLVEAVVESYPQLTGRSWKEMTYPEKDALDRIGAWAR